MQFYNLKKRSHVEVPDKDIRKVKMTRKTKTGEQTRYALTVTYEGSKLYKFVSKDVYESMNAPEE